MLPVGPHARRVQTLTLGSQVQTAHPGPIELLRLYHVVHWIRVLCQFGATVAAPLHRFRLAAAARNFLFHKFCSDAADCPSHHILRPLSHELLQTEKHQSLRAAAAAGRAQHPAIALLYRGIGGELGQVQRSALPIHTSGCHHRPLHSHSHHLHGLCSRNADHPNSQGVPRDSHLHHPLHHYGALLFATADPVVPTIDSPYSDTHRDVVLPVRDGDVLFICDTRGVHAAIPRLSAPVVRQVDRQVPQKHTTELGTRKTTENKSNFKG